MPSSMPATALGHWLEISSKAPCTLALCLLPDKGFSTVIRPKLHSTLRRTSHAGKKQKLAQIKPKTSGNKKENLPWFTLTLVLQVDLRLLHIHELNMISIGVVRLSNHRMHTCQASLIECRRSAPTPLRPLNLMADEHLACKRFEAHSKLLTLLMRTSSESRTHRAVVSWMPPVRAQTAPTASPRPTSSSTLTRGLMLASSLMSLMRPEINTYKQLAGSSCLQLTPVKWVPKIVSKSACQHVCLLLPYRFANSLAKMSCS